LNLRVRSTEDFSDDLCSFFAIEGRARVTVWDEFRVIRAIARAGNHQPAGSDNSPSLRQSEPGIVQVIEHPQQHNCVELAICNGQAGSICSSYLTVRTVGELARGFVDPDPLNTASKRRCESTDAATNVENPIDLLMKQSLDYRAVHILLPVRLE
jgi:hypothetical protein